MFYIFDLNKFDYFQQSYSVAVLMFIFFLIDAF